MKYFKIKVILGHAGNGKGIAEWVYIQSTSIIGAMKKAQQIPGVKHGKLPLETREITFEEYEEGLQQGKYYEKIDALQK
jgi:hypothetical protein